MHLRRRILLTSTAVAFAASVAWTRPDPPEPSDLPGGTTPGRLTSRWVAPYVAEQSTSIAQKGVGHTTWFAEDGAVVREVAASAGPGFVAVPGDGDAGFTIHGTLARWSLTLPKRSGERTWQVSADGRTFVDEKSDTSGAFFADVFVDGEGVGRTDAYPVWKGRGLSVGDDGTLAAIVAPETGGKNGPRVVVLWPGKRPTMRRAAAFEVPCHPDAIVEAVAPGARGVVVNVLDKRSWLSKAGTRDLDLGPNPSVVAWAPDSARAVVATSVGYRTRHHLVDFDTGATLWTAPDAPRERAASVVIEGDLVLIAALEAQAVEDVAVWRRVIRALDLATGKPVATWRSCVAGPVGYSEAPVFMRSTAKLYLVAPDQFAPVPMDDIRARRNGWE
jgi:hypothetical protein